MWSSLRTAVSGMLAQQRALDVAADNLTKMQIPGSKSQRVSFLELAPELRYLGVPDGEGNVLVDARETGRGVTVSANLQNMSQGAFLATGDPMDIAIDGDGFLEVTLPNGTAAYTHGGSLKLDAEGRLMTSTGATLSPAVTVPLESESVEIRPDGTVIAAATDGTRGRRIGVGFAGRPSVGTEVVRWTFGTQMASSGGRPKATRSPSSRLATHAER